MVWTSEEIQIIENNYTLMTDKELMKLLPNRNKTSIECKRKDMKLIRPRYRKYSFNDVLIEFSKITDYVLVSTQEEFIDCNSKMRYICRIHEDKGEQLITLNHIQTGRGCYYCGRESAASKREIELNKEFDRELCEIKGFKYIDTIRINGKITIAFICNNHCELGEQYMSKKNMERDIKGCKYCSGKQLPEWYVLKIANDINPRIQLLETYKNLTNSMNCICTKHNYNTKKTMQQILKGQGCYFCGKEKLSVLSFLDDDQVQSKINVLNPHVKLVEYRGNKTPSYFYCSKHNKSFNKYYETLLQNDSGCDYCYRENLRERLGMGIREFEKRLFDVHPELTITGEYINNSTPIKVYCTTHDYEFESPPVALLERKTCCDKTRITYKEEQVCKLLEEKWNFNITRQKIYYDCIDKRSLPFDIYLNDFNVLIEYQGEQHYRPIRYSNETAESANDKLEYTKHHDKIKKDYCSDNNIPLIEIPYWEYNDLEYFLFDKLVKIGVINEIKNTA